jgi:hypothetical protein
MVSFLDKSGADLCSGVPRQETGTFLEKLLIPLIHFVLLAFLPMKSMPEAYAVQALKFFRRNGHYASARKAGFNRAEFEHAMDHWLWRGTGDKRCPAQRHPCRCIFILSPGQETRPCA